MTDGMSGLELAVKRAFDFTAALAGLAALSPVLLLIALLLKWQGEGSALFRQERVGRHGRPFRILKFRTMSPDTEEDGVPRLTGRSDGRLTRLGRFLRERHLDELPQLWNILVGEMSFVGPRPERRFFVDRIMRENSDYEYVFLMRPGATSMATICNGYTDTMEKMLVRLQMDLDYFRRRSLLLDVRIMLKTARCFLSGKKF